MRQERDEIVTGRRSIRSSAPFILSGLSTAHGVFHWITQSFLVMLPEVKETFGLSPLQVGSITSIREAVGGVVSIPGGVLAGVLRRYWGLVLAICMTGFGLGWMDTSSPCPPSPAGEGGIKGNWGCSPAASLGENRGSIADLGAF